MPSRLVPDISPTRSEAGVPGAEWLGAGIGVD